MLTAKKVVLLFAVAAMIALPVRNAAAQSAPANPVKHLLDVASVAFPQMLKHCRTQACKDYANQATTLVQNAEQDYANGTLTGDNLANFFANLKSVSTQLQNEIVKGMTPAEQHQYNNCKGCQMNNSTTDLVAPPQAKTSLVTAVYHPSQQGHIVLVQQNPCQLCQQTFDQLSLICELYELDCPPCADACLIADFIEYEECLAQFGGCN